MKDIKVFNVLKIYTDVVEQEVYLKKKKEFEIVHVFLENSTFKLYRNG